MFFYSKLVSFYFFLYTGDKFVADYVSAVEAVGVRGGNGRVCQPGHRLETHLDEVARGHDLTGREGDIDAIANVVVVCFEANALHLVTTSAATDTIGQILGHLFPDAVLVKFQANRVGVTTALKM
jgi:hypothetical protein